MRWVVLAGEYPPQTGGVSDYTRLLAQGLARAGDEVHVWAPRCQEPSPSDPGVIVHRLPGRFGPRSLAKLHVALGRLPQPCRVLVQYVPHGFGWKAMNVPFCLWLFSQRRNSLRVMFHEVAFPFNPRQPIRHTVLAGVTHVMAALVVHAAEQLFVAIPAWAPLLRRLGADCRSVTWLPVPSNMPTAADPVVIRAARAAITPSPEGVVIGHFGTFGSQVSGMLREILPRMLGADTRRVALLLGRGGERCATDLIAAHPDLRGRIVAPGALAPERVTAYLAACDVLVQPYPDGVSSRRTSLMAGLALGLPIVTNEGPLTEAVWRETGAVTLARSRSPRSLVAAVDRVLSDPTFRGELRLRAAALYRRQFALEHTLERLRA